MILLAEAGSVSLEGMFSSSVGERIFLNLRL